MQNSLHLAGSALSVWSVCCDRSHARLCVSIYLSLEMLVFPALLAGFPLENEIIAITSHYSTVLSVNCTLNWCGIYMCKDNIHQLERVHWLNWLCLFICVRNTLSWEVVQPLERMLQKKGGGGEKILGFRQSEKKNNEIIYTVCTHEKRHMECGISTDAVLLNIFTNYHSAQKMVSMWCKIIE